MKRVCCLMILALCVGVPTARANQAEKVVVSNFAVPVAVPIAPYSPYYYSSSQVQQTQYSKPPRSADDILAERIAKKVAALMRSGNESPVPSGPPTLFAQKCALCHAQGDPEKGKPQLASLETLSDSQRLKAISAVMSGEMPKGGKLSADEAAQLVKELSFKPKAPAAEPIP